MGAWGYMLDICVCMGLCEEYVCACMGLIGYVCMGLCVGYVCMPGAVKSTCVHE